MAAAYTVALDTQCGHTSSCGSRDRELPTSSPMGAKLGIMRCYQVIHPAATVVSIANKICRGVPAVGTGSQLQNNTQYAYGVARLKHQLLPHITSLRQVRCGGSHFHNCREPCTAHRAAAANCHSRTQKTCGGEILLHATQFLLSAPVSAHTHNSSGNRLLQIPLAHKHTHQNCSCSCRITPLALKEATASQQAVLRQSSSTA